MNQQIRATLLKGGPCNDTHCAMVLQLFNLILNMSL